MQSNLLSKVTPKNRAFPLFISDQNSVFFIISDNKKDDNGLWFNNEKLLKYIVPENKDNSIENKTLSTDSLQVSYAKKANLTFVILKDSNGLLVELKSNKIISFPENNYNLVFNIDRDFQILEKNIKNIILKYEAKENEKNSNKFFLSINLSIDHDFENISQKDNYLLLSINSIEKTLGEPFLYLLYSYDYDDIKQKNEINTNKLALIKKDQIEKANTILENLKFNSEDKEINKFISYSCMQSNFLMKNIENKVMGLANQIPGSFFISGIYTFTSLINYLLVTGRYEDCREVLLSFLSFQNKNSSSQDFARIPSEIYSLKEIKYGSSKVTPVFIFCLYEYFSYTADFDLVMQSLESIKLAIDKQFLSKSSSDKENDIILNIDIELLWLAALLCFRQIISSIERNKYIDKDSKLFKDIINYSSIVDGKIKTIKSDSKIADFKMCDLLKEVHRKVSMFEFSKNNDLSDFFNKPLTQEQTGNVVTYSSNIENFLSSIEILRLIYHEHIGIIPQVYDRIIYISPQYKYNTSNIKSEIRVGYNEKISVSLRYNKKMLNVASIEVKAEEIEIPLLIIISVLLNQNVNTVNEETANIEIFLNTKSDYFTISFEQLNEKTLKIKEIVTHGKSYIESVKITK